MKKKIIEINCPICKGVVSYGELIKMDNTFDDNGDYIEDVISQEVECSDCKKRFEVIFAPIKIIKLK